MGRTGDVFFYQACEEARRLGADKLYISAHSSKENQAAYKALGNNKGAVIAMEPSTGKILQWYLIQHLMQMQ